MPKWTKEQDAYLLENYKRDSNSHIGRHLGFSASAVGGRYARLTGKREHEKKGRRVNGRQTLTAEQKETALKNSIGGVCLFGDCKNPAEAKYCEDHAREAFPYRPKAPECGIFSRTEIRRHYV